MHIKRLRIKNFKSIVDATIEFSPLSIIVGANAAGKSNLVSVFRFLEDITTRGLDNAIALQGGTEYISNVSLTKGTPIEIGFNLDLSDEGWIRRIISEEYKENKQVKLQIVEINYNFILQPHKRGSGYNIISDCLDLRFDVIKPGFEEVEDEVIGTYTQYFEKKSMHSHVQYRMELSDSVVQYAEISKALQGEQEAMFLAHYITRRKEELILNSLSLFFPRFFDEESFIRIFDFDPKELKKPSSMVSQRNLEQNGSNIALVLKKILRTKESKQKLLSIVHEYLPFVEGILIQNNLDQSVSYQLKETYNNKSFYSNFLSDGTVSILAIILALYFEEDSNVILLEEPERNIHPKLMAKMIASAKEVSKNRQIIITTHNAELLKQADVENIRLIKRNEQGITQIIDPSCSEIISEFLANDLGLDDLFIHDMLGV